MIGSRPPTPLPDHGTGGGILYLGVEDVLRAHARIFECSIQEAEDQLRDPSGLEGALARPLWRAHYGDADLALQAAVLACGIAEGQLFIDGNKRTALSSTRAFLLANGYTLSATQEERAQWILDLASGPPAPRRSCSRDLHQALCLP